MGRANPGLIVAAVACEWVSMVSFARMQRRLFLTGGQHLAIVSAVGIAFAENAVSVSVPVAGSGLGTAFTYRQFRRHRVGDAAAALALLVSGVLSTLTLTLTLAVMAAGALVSGNTVASAVGTRWAAAFVAGVAGLVLGLRKRAWQRLFERMAVGAVRVVQRLRHDFGQPEAVVAGAFGRLGRVRFRRSDWAVAAGMASLNWLGGAACLVLALTAARLAVPLRDVLLVWSAGVAVSNPVPDPGRGGHRRCGAGRGAGRSPGAHGGRGCGGSHLPADQLVAGVADRMDPVLPHRTPAARTGPHASRASSPARQDFARDPRDDPWEVDSDA